MTRLATGIQGFDGMVQGGLPVGSSVILQGPPGQEKLSFALTFLAEGLKAGASGLLVISSQSPDAVLAELRNLGVDLDAVKNDHRLRIVDWYSWSEEPVHDIEERGLVVRSSIDLANLGVALSRAIAALSGDQPRRAVIELLSPATNVYETTQVYAFAQSAKKKFDRYGFTSLVLLEKDMHAGSDITTLHQPFDGVIEIERTRSGDGIVRKIGVLHLKDTAPEPSFRVLEIAESGMRVVSESLKSAASAPAVSAGTVLESQEERARRLTLIMQIAGERLKANPRDTDALFAMAAAQATLDDSRGSLQSLERLSELDPKYPGLWVLKAKLHARLGEADRARQSRLRAQDVEPAEPTPVEPTVPCPMCDTLVAIDATVCGNCGVKFASARKLEDELEDLGHAAIQEMVHEGFQEDTPAAAPRKPAERRAAEREPRPALAPRTDTATPPKPAAKPTPKKGLTNGLVLGRGTGRRTGMTNGLRGRTNGLRGRTNGLTNGLGRTNGLTNGVGRTNGLTDGVGRTNGLTNGLGRTNGLTNGLGRTNGITNGLGRTNGLTNGLGGRRPSGFRSTGFRGMMRTAGWKLYLIPLVVVGLLLMPLFFVPEYNGPVSPIRIDGQFGDWSTVSTAAMGSGSVPNPNVDIVRFGVVDNLGPQAFYVQVVGTALQGGGASPGTMDSTRIFVDTDELSSTGYRIDGLGADRLIEVSGYAGVVRMSTLWEFDANRDTRDWSGWIKGTGAPAASSGSQIEVEAKWLSSGPSSSPFAATVHTASWNGEADVGDFPISPNGGSLSVVADPQVPNVISGNGVSLLRLTVLGHGQSVSLDSLQVQIVGTASPPGAVSLRLMDGGTVLDEVAPTSRDVTFAFPAMTIDAGSTLTFSIVGDFSATSGDTFGIRLPSRHPFGLTMNAVGLRENPGARNVGYLGSIPGAPRVDGGFGEWTALQTDASGDVSPRANPSIDLTRFGAQSLNGSTFLYADVTGRILQGSPVPETAQPTPIQNPPGAADTDRDSVPDAIDPLPLDFNNDGMSDANTNGDYDGDLIVDYGFVGGTDAWLNTTLPITFPPPYAGRAVSVYIGPSNRPVVFGDDVLRTFYDIDNSSASGFAIGGLGADRLVEVRGKDGEVTQSAVLAWSGSFPGDWSWLPISPVTVAVSTRAIEYAVSFTVAGVVFEAGDFWGGADTTASSRVSAPSMLSAQSLSSITSPRTSFAVRPASAPLVVPWQQVGPEPLGTLIDPNSNAVTTQYNHQRKVVRAGDVPVDTACDATNSDGCWYAIFYDQLVESVGNTQASTETITTGTKIGGTFPTDIQTENDVYIQYREAAFLAKQGSFNAGTGIVGSTVVITGVGFQPKAILFWWSGRTEATDTTNGADHKRGFGVAVSPTDRRMVYSQSDDAADPIASDRGHHNAAAIGALTTAGGIDGLADLQSMDSGGFTLVIADQFTTDLRVHYLALGGAALTNAVTGTFSEPAAMGNQDVTSLSFQPDAVIFFSNMQNTAPPTTTIDSSMMVGVAAGATPANAVWAGASNDAATTADTTTYSRAGESIAFLSDGAAPTNARASVTAWLSNGFRLNWAERSSNRVVHFLALKGGQYAVGDLLTQTDTTTSIVESGLGFSPRAGLLVSHGMTQSVADTPQSHDSWSMGAFTSPSEQAAMATWDEDATATAEVGTSLQHAQAYIKISAADAVDGLMRITSVDADGFTAIMDDADPAQSFVWYLAFGVNDLAVRYDWTGVPSGNSHTLQIKGYRGDENVNVQVLTPPSTWTTRITISATTNTMHTYTLTTSEYNAGAPSIRFVDVTAGDGTPSDLWLDYANIASSNAWDRVILMRSSDTSGSTWGSQIILASGRAGDSALLLARDSTEPSIAIDSGGFLHVVWAAANAAGDQSIMDRIRYTKSTVAYPTQAELSAAGNWEAVTNVDDASPGFMPTVSADSSNRPHIAWSGSKTEGTVYYKNKVGTGTIAVDSTVTSGSVTGAVASITVSHTTGSGTDRLMLIGVTVTNDGATGARVLNSVTWNSVSLTQVATVSFTDDARVWIYRLLNPVASTTANAVATFDGNVASIGGITMGVITFSGVDQATPLGTPVTESEGDGSITIAAAANEWIFDTISTEDATALTAGADQTQRWALLPNAVVAGGGSTQLGTANDIMSWTTTGSSHRAHAGVAIRPSTNAWGPTVSWGTSYTGVSVDVSPQNNYVSLARHGSVTTSGAEAEIAYRSNTGTNTVNSPKARTWDGSAWSGETEQSTASSPIRSARMAWSPIGSNTRIVVTLSDDGWLDAYVCAPTCTATNNIGQVWTTAPAASAHRFDIAYESLSGEALLVYSVVSTNTAQDLGYRTYTGSWSAEQYIDDTVEGTDIQYNGVRLASDRSSNRIGLVAETGGLNDANAWIWSGSAWGDYVELSADTASASDMEPIAIAWETNSGHLIAAGRDSVSNDVFTREFTTSWSAVNSIRCGPGGGEFLSLKSNPVGNDMILVNHDNGATFGTCYWTGSAWANGLTQDATTDAGDNRVADFAWESTGSKGLLVWGTTAGQITYRTFVAPNTWGTITNVAMGANQHPWVQLDTNRAPQAGGVKILGAVLEATANDLGAIKWDGTTFTVIGANMFSADVGVSTFESFELEYPDGAWYDGSWQSRKKITIDEAKVAADLTNFPVLVDITDADLRDDAQDDGDDILFTASDGVTKLNHEIEEFNGATGKLVAWVNVTSLSSTVNTAIYLYYGNAAATNQQNAAGTWDGNHKGVWHLDESPNDGVAGHDDSTANNNDGTPNNFQDGGGGSTSATGRISGADDFGGDDDYINVPNSASLDIAGDKITIEAWIQLATTFDSTATQHQTIIDGGGKIEYWLDEGDGKLHFSLNTGGTWLALVSTQASWTGGTWYHLVAVYDGANRFLYVNGVQDSTIADTGNLATNSYTRISDPAPATNEGPFNGIIDEVRISSLGRSAGWAQTTYNNRNDANFFSVGSKETRGAVVQRQIQFLACKNLAASNCDAAAEFTKADGAAGYDVVASDVPSESYPSLATTWEANGDLWVAYSKDVDGTTRGIYARFLDYPSAGWQTAETVDSTSGTVFTKPSIGIDASNDVHALYVDTSGPTSYYKLRTGGSWGSRTTVETPADNPTLMVRAPNDGYGTAVFGGLYWKTTTSETYFHIPEFDEVLVPVIGVLALALLYRRRRRSKPPVDPQQPKSIGSSPSSVEIRD